MKAVDLTPFGRFNRKLRIDHDEKLKEMAQKLGVTASFLSAVEIGHRNIPKSWGEKISKIYDLNDEQKQILNNSILRSKKVIKINLNVIEEEDKNTIFKILKKYNMQ